MLVTIGRGWDWAGRVWSGVGVHWCCGQNYFELEPAGETAERQMAEWQIVVKHFDRNIL